MDKKETACLVEMFNLLSNAIITHKYEQQRDMDFLVTYLELVSYGRDYKKWCQEYDQLNKHLLEEKLKDGELIAPR